MIFVYHLFQELLDLVYAKLKKLEPIIYNCSEVEKETIWKIANPWFGKNELLTNEALRIQNELDQARYSRSSDSFYLELDKQMYLAYGKYLKRYISHEN